MIYLLVQVRYRSLSEYTNGHQRDGLSELQEMHNRDNTSYSIYIIYKVYIHIKILFIVYSTYTHLYIEWFISIDGSVNNLLHPWILFMAQKVIVKYNRIAIASLYETPAFGKKN